jgi:hypothetical protein
MYVRNINAERNHTTDELLRDCPRAATCEVSLQCSPRIGRDTGRPVPPERTPGTVAMAEESNVTRAHMLAQMASSKSVTTDVLADEERQFADARLAEDPPVSYLAKGEAPAFVFTNTKRGIGLGAKRSTVEPDKNRGAAFLITGRRTIALVGQDDGDVTYSLPHESVAWAAGHTGFLANRLELRTPAKAYHCWVDRSVPSSVLDEAVSFIEQRTVDDPDPIPGDEEASVMTWRGSSVSPDASREQSSTEETANDD